MKFTDKLYLSTLSADATAVARRCGTGLEVCEFCTASNMDEGSFEGYDRLVRTALMASDRFVFHAPFNELFPSAVDPLAVELAMRRYHQAARLAQTYGMNRMVVHSGFVPLVYFESWFIARSITFWADFLKDEPEGFCIYVENVLESTPDALCAIMEGLSHPRARLCLDVGHAFLMSRLPLSGWIKQCSPWLGHVHLHSNDGQCDRHWAPGQGKIDICAVLDCLLEYAPQATVTLETTQAIQAMEWLAKSGYVVESSMDQS